MVDPKRYANSTVYINKLNIQNHKALALAELRYTALRTLELTQGKNLIALQFNAEHLKAIHHYLFSDLFHWAGQWRSYDVAKGSSIFTPANQLEAQSTRLFTALREQLQQNSQVLPLLTRNYILINKLHPFPEGNGRTQRVFTTQLANQLGCSLNWAAVHNWEIRETAIAAQERNDEQPTENMLKRIPLS